MSLVEQVEYFNRLKRERQQHIQNNLKKIHDELLVKAKAAGFEDNIEAYISSLRTEPKIIQIKPAITNHWYQIAKQFGMYED